MTNPLTTAIRFVAGEDLPAGAILSVDPDTGHIVRSRERVTITIVPPGTLTEDPADPHVDDLVLARTAITPGRRYWTCARFLHSIDPRDFVHTNGPCPDDQTPSTPLPASSEPHA
jgi:hypothetical protein